MRNEYSSAYSSLAPRALVSLERLDARRIADAVAPSTAIRHAAQDIRGRIAETGAGWSAALDEFDRWLLPATLATTSARYWGLVNCTPWPEAAWMDLLVSALNNNAGAEHQGPSAAVAEAEVLAALGERLGWSPTGEAHFVAGGSIANLEGTLLMRHARFPTWLNHGPPRELDRVRIYCHAESHFSVQRSLQATGFGARHLVAAPMTDDGRIDAHALEATIRADYRRGLVPTAIFATFGTTATGAIDDLDAMVRVARTQHVWLHVDACYGGAALLLPEFAAVRQAVAEVDSMAMDPHKWMYMPVACAITYTRHRRLAFECFAPRDRSYIPGGDEYAFLRGFHTSRRAVALSLWTTLRAVGWNRLRSAIAQDINHARFLERHLAGLGYEVLGHRRLSVVCARAPVAGWHGEDLDVVQAQIAEQITDEGTAWFSTTRHGGRVWLRFNFINLYTSTEDIVAVCDRIEAVRRELEREYPTAHTTAPGSVDRERFATDGTRHGTAVR